MDWPDKKHHLNRRQFSLQSLLAATVFAGLGLAACRLSGLSGFCYLVAFISIVTANLGIAVWGFQRRDISVN